MEKTASRVRVEFGGIVIAETSRALRILETSHPPTYYIPPADIRTELLVPSIRRSFCEFKGSAAYWSVRTRTRRSEDAAWSYANPLPPYEGLLDHIAFYANRVDACFVDNERVQPQAGGFYGGWITSNVVGPFKGSAGTADW
jgi:uncharacterized protein (DUF427 family)